MRVHLQQQRTEHKAHLPTIDKRLKARGSGARQCEWCDTRRDRGRAACAIYFTAALIQHVTASTPDPLNDTFQASRAGDEPVDGHDGLPRAEGTHGDQRRGQKGQGSRTGAGHRQATGEESKTRERSRQAKPKARGQRQPTGRLGVQKLRKLVNLSTIPTTDQLAIWRQDHSVIFLQTDAVLYILRSCQFRIRG